MPSKRAWTVLVWMVAGDNNLQDYGLEGLAELTGHGSCSLWPPDDCGPAPEISHA